MTFCGASAMGYAHSSLKCAAACTPGNASPSVTILPGSPCTLVRGLPALRLGERCWFRKQYVIWSPARDYLLRTGGYTLLKVCQMSGVYSGQC